MIISKDEYYLVGCNTMLSRRSSLSHITEDTALHSHRCKNLESNISKDTAQYAIKMKYTAFLYTYVFHKGMKNGGSRPPSVPTEYQLTTQ
jgi:hypothetical protein